MRGLHTCSCVLLSLSTIRLSEFAATNECSPNGYSLVDMYDGRRSSDWVTQNSDVVICDFGMPDLGSWLRFDHQAGVRMPESCIDLYRCGTESPIWMNGSHPTEYEVVPRQVCANYGNPSGHCCDWTATISVRKCRAGPSDTEDFFVYRLANPERCNIAYCVNGTTHKPCPPGYLWSPENIYCYENGTQPTSRTQPPTGPQPNTTPGPPGVSTTTPTAPPPGGWGPWTEWSACSKSCDYGQQHRTRRCLASPCTGDSTETRSCATNNCEENPDEKPHGLIVVLQSTEPDASWNDTMLKVVINEKSMLETWRNETNKQCFNDMTACCGKPTNYHPLTPVEFVKPDDIRTAAGYPRPSGTYQVKLKFIAVLNNDIASAACDSTSNYARSAREQVKESSDSTVFISSTVLENVVNNTVKDIKDLTGLTVVSTVTPDQEDTSSSGFPVWAIVVICVLSALVLVAIVILAYYLYCKHRSTIIGVSSGEQADNTPEDNGNSNQRNSLTTVEA